MKLSEYVSQVCAGLDATATDKNGKKGNVTLTLSPEDAAYRGVISSALKDIFLGKGMLVIDALFDDCDMGNALYRGICNAHQEKIGEIAELKAKLGAMTAERPVRAKPKAKLTLNPANNSVTKDTAKPKRVIQSAPKKGNIEQERLDAAIQGLRKRRAEKKAAQKAKKDE